MKVELISAIGKGFEVIKAFVHSLERNGCLQALSTYLASQEVQDRVARLIIGGPWGAHGTVLEMEMDWSESLIDLSREMPDVVCANLFLPDKSGSVFVDRYVNRPLKGKQTCKYIFYQCPRIEVENVETWFDNLTQRSDLEWVDERELTIFGTQFFPYSDFELLTAGVKGKSPKSPSGQFASFSNGRLGVRGFSEREKLPTNGFFLFRWVGE